MKREAKAMVVPQTTISPEVIRGRILTFRGVPVMLDRDLADLYGVPTGALNQAVKRNIERFPERFMFQLSDEEFKNWKSQIVISNSGGADLTSQNLTSGGENWISQNATSNLTGSAVRMGLRKRPFDLPKGWAWCRFGDVAYSIASKLYQVLESTVKRTGLYPVVSQGQNSAVSY